MFLYLFILVFMSSFSIEVQDYFLWCSQAISEMSAEESISDVATATLQLAQHQQLWTEMEARQETYQQALDMGEELQAHGRSNKREVKLEGAAAGRAVQGPGQQWHHFWSSTHSVGLNRLRTGVDPYLSNVT